jgi:hypothetical protein
MTAISAAKATPKRTKQHPLKEQDTTSGNIDASYLLFCPG